MNYILMGYLLGIGLGLAYATLMGIAYIVYEIVMIYKIKVLKKICKKQHPKDMIFG